MNPNVVAGLVNRVYTNFNMFSFDNRIKVQKFVYLMQSMFKLNLGYEFNWYHYGPYCAELAKDCFGINFEEVGKAKFEDPAAESKFGEFQKFIEAKDAKWMEIVASIHFLKRLGYPKEKVIETIKNKRGEMLALDSEIKTQYEELESGGKLND